MELGARAGQMEGLSEKGEVESRGGGEKEPVREKERTIKRVDGINKLVLAQPTAVSWEKKEQMVQTSVTVLVGFCLVTMYLWRGWQSRAQVEVG